MQLYTKRLHIRPFIKSDLYDVYEYCSQDGVGEHAGWAAHSSLWESARILSDWISAGDKYAIVLLDTGKVIGHISIHPDSDEARLDTRELGCVLNLQYHRQGIMTEAITAVLEYLFHSQDIQFVWACCFQDNVASKGMIEKCGFYFMQEGVFFSASLDKEFPSYEYRITKEEFLAASKNETSLQHKAGV